ncbi:hypothetical protein COCSADRAFT_219242 [Bipolaris sorokiniana ND90Pr]|uniref:Uncharacterized protein n=1 Tax=Cochliobolus sativus (strain ND90Pr / ATCC 201652) TaxID=665912 RepID=M2SZB4_COCSN|nr:uncharacterized protein COCSADRAFT_219242 [Bipolaris sorokiniana ND90Pr]EMD62296.1 hypothetical protein COCSADRAFT_219242 [Bipolaris sorokiniana ND90Pr]
MKLHITLALAPLFCTSVTAWFCLSPPGTFTLYGLCRYSDTDSSKDLYCLSTTPCTKDRNNCSPSTGDRARCN